MALVSGLPTASLRKLPLGDDALISRGEWSYCALEHSRIPAVELNEAGSPFHHLALPLGRERLHLTFQSDGRRQFGRNAADTMTMIEAGASASSGWDGIMESACLYFTNNALAHALGLDIADVRHDVRSRLSYHSPALARLIHALLLDAAAGQPHGTLIGDAIFVALAYRLTTSNGQFRRTQNSRGEPWRVRNALAYIHENLTDELSIPGIAKAAGTSPFYLNRAFRLSIGRSIWQYVLHARANYAAHLMRDERMSLVTIAQSAGFQTYPAFIATVSRAFGKTPSALRRSTGAH